MERNNKKNENGKMEKNKKTPVNICFPSQSALYDNDKGVTNGFANKSYNTSEENGRFRFNAFTGSSVNTE